MVRTADENDTKNKTKLTVPSLRLPKIYSGKIEAKEILEKIANSEPVVYNNVLIYGDLDVNKIDLPRGENNKSLVASEIIITNSEINGNVRFSNTIFWKSINFRDTRFNQTVEFEHTRFSENVEFVESKFYEDINFNFARFYNRVSFLSTHFKKPAQFMFAKFESNAVFEWTLFLILRYFLGPIFIIPQISLTRNSEKKPMSKISNQ